MKNIQKTALIIALILGAGLLFYLKIYLPKVTNKVVPAKKELSHSSVFGIGEVDAKDIYPITAQTGGKVSAIFCDEGKWVKKGELLATIDSVELPSLLKEAEATRQKAEFESLVTQNELQNLNAQKELIEINAQRYEKLYAQKYISKAEYDKTQTDLKTINAQIASSHAHKSAVAMDIKRATSAQEALQTKLSRLQIFSPIDGYVISKDVQVAQNILPTQSILTIVDPKTLWIKAFIDEKISSQIRVGQSAKIKLRSQADKEFEGKVERVWAVSDATTGERTISVSFNNPPFPFYIHEQAEVTIQTAQRAQKNL